jgi:PAS domain-containing protein
MRGSLRIRHAAGCPAAASGRARDARACRCSPAGQARVAGVVRALGHLPRGWRADDVLPFERELAELRGMVLDGKTPKRAKIVTLADWAVPWLEGIAAQAEAGRMSPLTYTNYEGDWRLYLEPAFGRLPLPAIDHAAIVRFQREHIARGISESRIKGVLIPLSGMLTDAMDQGLVDRNPVRSPRRARHRGGSRHDFIDLQPTRRPPRLLEPHQARSLLDATPQRYVDLVLAGLTTGFRRNELLGLRWEWLEGPPDRPTRPALLEEARQRPRARGGPPPLQVRLRARGAAVERPR